MPMPRKAEALHELNGTKPHDRTVDVSHVPAGRPKVPADINKFGLRSRFKRLCRLLAERRVLTAGDQDLIRLFCIIEDRHKRNVKLLREEGELCTYFRLDSNGQSVPQVKTNLRLKICVEAERQMAQILTQLGLTQVAKDRAKPTANPSLKVVPGSVADVMPWLLDDSKPPEFKQPEPILPEDMDRCEFGNEEKKPSDETMG